MWVKVTPGVIAGYFRGKRINVKQGDRVEDAGLVSLFPRDFRELSLVVPSSSSPQEPSGAPPLTKEELERKSKRELLAIARELGIESDSMKKDELITAILEAEDVRKREDSKEPAEEISG